MGAIVERDALNVDVGVDVAVMVLVMVPLEPVMVPLVMVMALVMGVKPHAERKITRHGLDLPCMNN